MSAEDNLARFVARTLDNADATARSQTWIDWSTMVAATAAGWKRATVP